MMPTVLKAQNGTARTSVGAAVREALYGSQALVQPLGESPQYVEDRDRDQRELDGRADRGKGWREAASIASECEQQGDVFGRVEARGGEGEERDDGAGDREAPRV